MPLPVVSPQHLELIALSLTPFGWRRTLGEPLRAAEKTVNSMAQRELQAFKVRRRWRLRRDDLVAWINTQRAPARSRK